MEESKKKKILLCVLIILVIVFIVSVFIIIYNYNKDAEPEQIIEPRIDPIESHNISLQRYDGYRYGSDVKALYQTVIITNDKANKDAIIVSINGISDVQELNDIMENIDNKAKYTVETNEYNEEGYITGISVKLNDN